MSVSWGKVRLVGQFDILAWDNLFSSQLRLVGQFVLRSCPTGRTPVYYLKFFEIFILYRFGFNPHDIFIEHEEFNDDTIQSIGEGHFGCVYRFS